MNYIIGRYLVVVHYIPLHHFTIICLGLIIIKSIFSNKLWHANGINYQVQDQVQYKSLIYVGRNLWCGSAQSMDRAAQSMDPCRNPWIAQESVDRAGRSMNFAYDTIPLAQTYMDGLVISTNLKFNNFTHFNGLNWPLHRNSASWQALKAGRPAVIYYYYYARAVRTRMIRRE